MALHVTDVQKALKGVDYPASQDELARHAEATAPTASWSRRSAA
jgi:Protein of unknown function (DUF2795)